MEGLSFSRLSVGIALVGTVAIVIAAATVTVTQSEERLGPSILRSSFDVVQSVARYTSSSFQQQYSLLREGDLSLYSMLECLTLCTLLPGIWLLRSRRKNSDGSNGSVKSRRDELKGNRKGLGSIGSADSALRNGNSSCYWHQVQNTDFHPDREDNDPGLLRKHSSYRSYTTSVATYSRIRTFFRPHPQAEKLPSTPTPLPLLVFIHGLGGSLAQFHPLLTSLVNVSGCLGIDLPGCGLSDFAPSSWKAYTTEALVELLAVVIKDHLDDAHDQGIVLIAHSLGCSLSALLASSSPRTTINLAARVLGLVAICPRADPPSREQVAKYRMLLSIPSAIFDLWRRWDRRGGPESASVARFVGRTADEETKKLQHRFNEQSKTPVWRRMAWGALPVYHEDGLAVGGLPGREIWSGLNMPVLLAAGEADTVTSPEEVITIAKYLGIVIRRRRKAQNAESEALPISAGEVDPIGLHHRTAEEDFKAASDPVNFKDNTSLAKGLAVYPKPRSLDGNHKVVQTSILPAPASHALLYDPATYRTLAGLIQTFLSEHVDQRLSLGWQLQLLTTEGKWDVKNLAKWQAVRPVSEPIAGTFRAMKTLREIDDTHSPAIFVEHWKDRIRSVIDISHESPIYDPKGLELGGIEYHKFPTVSKIPPTVDEVRDFIKLVDRLWNSTPASEDSAQQRLIGVHCHYGFNRTGFFICSYLIERQSFSVQDAIDEFQKRRQPGIRHEHFIDTLFARYCIGLKSAPTL